MPNYLYPTTSNNDAFEAYQLYVALRNHFTSKSYDFFRYNGKIKTAKTQFVKRPDTFWFHKLAQHKDPQGFLVSNFAYEDGKWIGELMRNTEAESNYVLFCKTRDSLTYTFKQDIAKMDIDFDTNLVVEEGQHPKLLKLYLRKQMTLESLCMLEQMCGFARRWNRKITDNILWPTIALKIGKFTPFVQHDKEKFKKIVVDHFK